MSTNPFSVPIAKPFRPPPITCWSGWIYPFDGHAQFTDALYATLQEQKCNLETSSAQSTWKISFNALWYGTVVFGTEDGFIRCYIKRINGDPVDMVPLLDAFKKKLDEIEGDWGIKHCPAMCTPAPPFPITQNQHAPRLTIKVDDPHLPTPVPTSSLLQTDEYTIPCPHCGAPSELLNAPLACGCVPCSCYCPNWGECPRLRSHY